jgi:uncharacterized protein YqeY
MSVLGLEPQTARRELTTRDFVDVIQADFRERTAAAAEYQRLDRAEQASKLKAEAAALQTFLETVLKEL